MASSVIGGAALGMSGFGKAAFQFGAHSLSGGALSAAQGGNFWSGAAAGGFSSGVGSGIDAIGGGATAQWLGGGLSGGVGSSLAGGNFWQGAGQGLITAGLNHAAHTGIEALQHDPPSMSAGDPLMDKLLSNSPAVDLFGSGLTGSGALTGYAASGLSLGASLGIQSNFRSLKSYNLYRSNGTLNGNGTVSGRRFMRVAGALNRVATGLTWAGGLYDGYQGITTGQSGYLNRGVFSTMAAYVPVIGWGASYLISRSDVSHWNWTPREYKRDWSKTCFIRGTEILMSDGSIKKIELIEEGDKILSVNISSMNIEEDIVVIVPDHEEKYNQIYMKYSNGVENNCSAHHPFYVKDKGWCVYDVEMAEKDLLFKVHKLEKGDIVFSYEKGNLQEVTITEIIDMKRSVPMYNIKYVKKNNTFFANGVLVHNRFEN